MSRWFLLISILTVLSGCKSSVYLGVQLTFNVENLAYAGKGNFGEICLADEIGNVFDGYCQSAVTNSAGRFNYVIHTSDEIIHNYYYRLGKRVTLVLKNPNFENRVIWVSPLVSDFMPEPSHPSEYTEDVLWFDRDTVFVTYQELVNAKQNLNAR